VTGYDICGRGDSTVSTRISMLGAPPLGGSKRGPQHWLTMLCSVQWWESAEPMSLQSLIKVEMNFIQDDTKDEK